MLVYLQMIGGERERQDFEAFYRAYRNLAFHVAREMLPRDEDAEDAVAQAFEAAARHFEKILKMDGPKRKAYFVIVVERKCIDMLRQQQRRAEYQAEDMAGAAAEVHEEHGLAQALGQLPAEYREVILLRYYHGYSAAEIGTLLGMQKGSVQKRLWRAKETLRKKLEEANGDGQ